MVRFITGKSGERQTTTHSKANVADTLDSFGKPRHRNSWYARQYELRMRQQRSQRAKANLNPSPSPVITKVLIDGVVQELPRFGTHQQRHYVLNRDSYACRYCQCAITMETANLDHVSPHKYGGPTSVDNLVAACQRCNKAKGNNLWKPKARKTVAP